MAEGSNPIIKEKDHDLAVAVDRKIPAADYGLTINRLAFKFTGGGVKTVTLSVENPGWGVTYPWATFSPTSSLLITDQLPLEPGELLRVQIAGAGGELVTFSIGKQIGN